MAEERWPQTPSERERESDRLFLEFAVKKCALTLSKVEILSLTERILTETSEQAVEAILAEYRREPEEPAAAAPASIAAESASPAGETAPPIPAAAGPPALTAETVPPAVPPPPRTDLRAGSGSA